MGARLDVVGIGNALVDDAFLAGHGLVKGSMALLDADRALQQDLDAAVERSGGWRPTSRGGRHR